MDVLLASLIHIVNYGFLHCPDSIQEVCHQYWPSTANGGRVKTFGEYTVTIKKEVDHEAYTERTFTVNDPKVSTIPHQQSI